MISESSSSMSYVQAREFYTSAQWLGHPNKRFGAAFYSLSPLTTIAPPSIQVIVLTGSKLNINIDADFLSVGLYNQTQKNAHHVERGYQFYCRY